MSVENFDIDKKYILKKLRITDEEFLRIMNLPPKSFNSYGTYLDVIKHLDILLNFHAISVFFLKILREIFKFKMIVIIDYGMSNLRSIHHKLSSRN